MKKLILITVLMVALLSVGVFAATPERVVSVQGKLTDNSGYPITTAVSVVFDIFNVQSGGTSLKTVTDTITPDSDGIFNYDLDVSGLNFNEQYWVEVEVDGQTLGPRIKMTQAPSSLSSYFPQAVEIETNRDDILRLVSTDTGTPWNYITFWGGNPSVRQWWMGQDSSGIFRIQADAGGGRITITPSTGDIGMVGDLNVGGGNIYLPDSNTTLHSESLNSLNITTNSGWMTVGPRNTVWAHFYTDRPSFYFSKGAAFTGHVDPYNQGNYDLGDSTNSWRNLYLKGSLCLSGDCKSSWPSGGGGTVTSVGTGSGLTGGPITTSGTISVSSGGITSSHLATNSVYAAEIAANAVGASEIASNAVGAAEIAANAVGASELASNSVGTSEVAFNYAGSTSEGGAAIDSDKVDGKHASDLFSVCGSDLPQSNLDDWMVTTSPPTTYTASQVCAHYGLTCRKRMQYSVPLGGVWHESGCTSGAAEVYWYPSTFNAGSGAQTYIACCY